MARESEGGSVRDGVYDIFFFFQAEGGVRYFCLSRGLGDVFKGQVPAFGVML